MQTPTRPSLRRRDLFKLLAAAGVAAAGGYALFEYPPWLNYDQQASASRSPGALATAVAAPLRELVRAVARSATSRKAERAN